MTPQESSRPDSSSGPGDHPLDSLLCLAFEERPLCAGLYESIRDIIFAPKLPPLELTSTPIPVLDRMAMKTNPWAVGTATIANGGVLVLVLCLSVKAVIKPTSRPTPHTHVDLSDFNLLAPLKAYAAGGGGGGGSNDPIAPIEGRLPRFEKTPLTPPQVPMLERPKLAIDSAIVVQPDIKLPDNLSMPNIGVRSSPNVWLLSGGPGTHSGIGTGIDGGLGPGIGIGLGPGTDQGVGTGVYSPGGGITNPIPIVTPEAEFSDEARRTKYQGVCMISIIVDTYGFPQNPRVIRPLGMGLDEKALEAVRKYRFKPSMREGKPVAVMITVAVNFRLY